MSGAAYLVGIEIALSGNASAALGVLAGQMAGLNAHATSLIKKFGQLGTSVKMALGGAVAIGAGVGIIEGLKGLAEHGQDLLDQQDKLQRSGMSLNDVLKVQADYYDRVSKAVPTASADQYLKTINEMQSVVGLDKAQQVAPYALKLDAIIGNALGKDVEGSGFSIWRALEMRGTTMSDFAGSQKLADAMAQVIIGSGGKITAGTYQQVAKRAGSSWMQFDPSYITGGLSVAAGDMGGDTAGTAAMSLQQFLTGAHTLSKQQLGVLKDAGLIDMSKVTTDKGGRINMQPGAIKGSAEGASDQYHWVKDTVEPALMKLAGGDKSKFGSFLAKLGSNRSVTRLLAMFSDPGIQEQIEKDIALWDKASPVDKAYGDATANNPKVIEQAYEAQKKSLLEAIGAPLMQAAIPVMKSLTEVFNTIGKFANDHSAAIKQIGVALGGLGVALTAIGAAAVLAAAAALIPGGVVAVAITAIGAIIAALVAYNWEGVKNAFTTVKDAITKVASELIDGIMSLPGRVIGAINDAMAAIGNAFVSAIKSLAGGGALQPGQVTPKNGPLGAPYVSPYGPKKQSSIGDVYLHGRKVGQLIGRQMVADAQIPRGPAGFDTRAGFTPVDWAPA